MVGSDFVSTGITFRVMVTSVRGSVVNGAVTQCCEALRASVLLRAGLPGLLRSLQHVFRIDQRVENRQHVPSIRHHARQYVA